MYSLVRCWRGAFSISAISWRVFLFKEQRSRSISRQKASRELAEDSPGHTDELSSYVMDDVEIAVWPVVIPQADVGTDRLTNHSMARPSGSTRRHGVNYSAPEQPPILKISFGPGQRADFKDDFSGPERLRLDAEVLPQPISGVGLFPSSITVGEEIVSYTRISLCLAIALVLVAAPHLSA